MNIETTLSFRFPVTTAALSIVFAAASPALAAPTFLFSNPSVSIASASNSNGTYNVTASTLIKVSSGSATVSAVGLCARQDGAPTDDSWDFTKSGSTVITSSGTSVTKTRSFPAGWQGTVFGCLNYNGGWYNSGTVTLVIPGAAPHTNPSGEAAPLGDVTSNGHTWHQVLRQEFTTAAAGTAFSDAYPFWAGYPDGSGEGKYVNTQVISAHDGVMDWNLHIANGVRIGGAGTFTLPAGYGQLYGRYSIRFKASAAFSGFGMANMLWPDSDVWGDGEIDWTEGNFASNLHAFHHCLGDDAASNCSYVNYGVTAASGWHTFTVEWSPSAVRYYRDGTLVLTNTDAVPFTQHSWRLQAANDGSSSSAGGHLLIDWVTAYTY
ncbi:glycoside hydrolase family 16 protein [Cystobacter fuscus]